MFERSAHARASPRTSSRQSRRSKPIEALIRANSGSCGWSKRAMARVTIGSAAPSPAVRVAGGAVRRDRARARPMRRG